MTVHQAPGQSVNLILVSEKHVLLLRLSINNGKNLICHWLKATSSTSVPFLLNPSHLIHYPIFNHFSPALCIVFPYNQ